MHPERKQILYLLLYKRSQFIVSQTDEDLVLNVLFRSVHQSTLPGIGLVCTLKVFDLVPEKIKKFIFKITWIGLFNYFIIWVINFKIKRNQFII